MTKQPTRPTGQTKDVGWQIGVRRTLPMHPDAAWKWVISPEGADLWLGQGAALDFEKGATYQLADGTTGEVRVCKPGSHLRITYQPPGRERASTIQVRVIPSGEKTIFAFHEEHLPDETAREQRRAFYQSVLDSIEGGSQRE